MGSMKITGTLLDVLEVLIVAFAERAEVTGWVIIKTVRRSAPAVYGVLDELEDAGWLTSRWEPDGGMDRPRRRIYALSAEGCSGGRQLLEARRPWHSRPRSFLGWIHPAWPRAVTGRPN